MESRESKMESESLGVFLVGAAVGAGLALLLMPRSGPETRRRLGHWIHEHRGLTHEFWDSVKELLSMKHNGSNGRARKHGGA